jgi:putative transposase
MPNARRFHAPGFPQHVVQRGNDRQPCFRHVDDFNEYLARLALASKKYDVAVHAYVLMPNHVHLLATPAAMDGVARVMQAVGSAYVRSFNARHARTGTLWDSRYFSSVVGEDDYFWNCQRYIELNPVRAAIVARPESYRWSSHMRNAFGHPDRVVTPHHMYVALARQARDAPKAYRKMFGRDVESAAILAIRAVLHQERAYGDEAFIARVEQFSRRSPRCRSRGRPAALSSTG